MTTWIQDSLPGIDEQLGTSWKEIARMNERIALTLRDPPSPPLFSWTITCPDEHCLHLWDDCFDSGTPL